MRVDNGVGFTVVRGRVLIVAGSDSGGGAGIQADIKTVTMLGGYAMTAVTALTAQNTHGVTGIVAVDPDFVEAQIRAVWIDLGVDCVKTGMLVGAATVRRVARVLTALAPDVRLVVDPVMVAKGGAKLLEDEAREALLAELVPRATLLTPNTVEAEALTGHEVRYERDLETAADRLLDLGARAVLIKGGHLEGPGLVDLLKTREGDVHRFVADRIDTRSTHGTGCTLASAIATGLARGLELTEAVERAHTYVQRAIRTAPGLGGGHGPLNHSHPLEDLEDELARTNTRDAVTSQSK